MLLVVLSVLLLRLLPLIQVAQQLAQAHQLGDVDPEEAHPDDDQDHIEQAEITQTSLSTGLQNIRSVLTSTTRTRTSVGPILP